MKSEVDEEVCWQTIDMVRAGGVAYAYQQKVIVRETTSSRKKSGYHNGGMGVGVGESAATIPQDEHRLKPVRETIDEESMKNILGGGGQ